MSSAPKIAREPGQRRTRTILPRRMYGEERAEHQLLERELAEDLGAEARRPQTRGAPRRRGRRASRVGRRPSGPGSRRGVRTRGRRRTTVPKPKVRKSTPEEKAKVREEIERDRAARERKPKKATAKRPARAQAKPEPEEKGPKPPRPIPDLAPGKDPAHQWERRIGDELIPIEKIHLDSKTQARTAIRTETVAEYAEVVREWRKQQQEAERGKQPQRLLYGRPLPDVILFGNYEIGWWVGDGWHRILAHKEAGEATISAELYWGTEREARLHAAGANNTHGLPRTREDKRRAVQLLLEDDECKKWSDREIARQCRVSHPTVSALRQELTGKFTSEEGERLRQGADGRVINTTNIGKAPEGGIELAPHYAEILRDLREHPERTNGELARTYGKTARFVAKVRSLLEAGEAPAAQPKPTREEEADQAEKEWMGRVARAVSLIDCSKLTVQAGADYRLRFAHFSRVTDEIERQRQKILAEFEALPPGRQIQGDASAWADTFEATAKPVVVSAGKVLHEAAKACGSLDQVDDVRARIQEADLPSAERVELLQVLDDVIQKLAPPAPPSPTPAETVKEYFARKEAAGEDLLHPKAPPQAEPGNDQEEDDAGGEEATPAAPGEPAAEHMHLLGDSASAPYRAPMRCEKCGCTDEDCRQCIEKTGRPCSWVRPGLCSACVPELEDEAEELGEEACETCGRLYPALELVNLFGEWFCLRCLPQDFGDRAVAIASGEAKPKNRALYSSTKDDWCTPKNLLEWVTQLGPIGVDPCSNPDAIVKCRVKWTRAEDGLSKDWTKAARGKLVYVNPPYGRPIGGWVAKALEEAKKGAELVLLLPARTDVSWFFEALNTADAICFWRGRITFLGAEHPAPFPSVVVYYGPNRAVFESVFCQPGRVLFTGRGFMDRFRNPNPIAASGAE